MVYEMDNGILRMLVRLHDGIGESYSYDRGRKWSKGGKTKLGSPSSRFFIKKLNSGRVLLINHYKFKGRNNLTALLSDDDGVTFPYSLLLDERDSVSYPDAVECDNGMIRITYDRERGCFLTSLEDAYSCAREILTACITEEDILKGTLSSGGSYLKRVACKLSRLSENDSDPYAPPVTDISLYAKSLIESESIDPIEDIFEKFPLDCSKYDMHTFKNLDNLIAQFKESGNRDVRILEQIISITSGATKIQASYPIVEEVCAYIQKHLPEEITNEKLSEAFHISAYYLSHIFKFVTGITITEYKNELKLTQAKLLLKNSDWSIAQIACNVGFNNVSYFTEVFSKSEKISPKKYRELHKRG
jgi:AraC-like DNA-binding protein